MVLVNVRDGQTIFISKDILTWYLLSLKLRGKNQQSKPVQDQNHISLPEINRSDQDEAIEERRRKTRESWVISIRDKIEQANKDDDMTRWGKLCIYRVPHYLHGKENKCYSPQIVSLGPYHHGKEQTRSMECDKWRALNKILKRTKQSIEMYIDAMAQLEEKARACYQGPIDLSSEEFTEMLVLDGCFVLELFKGTVEGFQEIGYAHNDPVFATRGLMHLIQRDMLLLENQFPLFVLDRLLQLQLCTQNQTGIVADLALRFFYPLMPTGEALTKPNESKLMNYLDTDSSNQKKSLDSLSDNGGLHCLDVFRQSLLYCSPARSLRTQDTPPDVLVDKRKRQELVHCVTELREAGVKFRKKETGRFWDIQFNNGCLDIPKLFINDGTKSLFSNLIAFEQCHIDSSNHITSYVIFMDNLINSSGDVSYLHYHGIIEHWLGSDSEVADLFNRLCQEVVFDPRDSYLSQVSDDVNRYYNRKWNVLKATLKHKYFSNPWAYFSFFAAVILLLLTLSQSFYAVYAYYKPPS